MASPAEEQIVANYDKLSEYLASMRLYLQDPEANPPPVFNTYAAELKYEDVLTLVKSRVMDNPSFAVAKAQDEITKVEALLRENLLRNFSKRNYYDNADSGLEREEVYTVAEKTKTVKYLQGKMAIQGGE